MSSSKHALGDFVAIAWGPETRSAWMLGLASANAQCEIQFAESEMPMRMSKQFIHKKCTRFYYEINLPK